MADKSLTRRQKENAIAAKFPHDLKRGRGDNRVIMVVGNVASVLGVKNFTRFTMASGMTDKQIDVLYNWCVTGQVSRHLCRFLYDCDVSHVKIETV